MPHLFVHHTKSTHCLYLLSEQTQHLQHYTFNSHLLHVSAIFGHHQVDFTREENTEVEAPFKVNT